MANPQKENGSTDIANELLEAIYSYDFTITQIKIVFCIIRFTYGFKRKKHTLSLNFIKKAINGSSRAFISKEIKKLINSNILIEYSAPSCKNIREIGINKDYNMWKKIGVVQACNCCTSVQHPVVQAYNTPVVQACNQETKNKETKNKEIKYNSEFTNFEALWKLYPRKDGKINAFKKYQRVNRKVSDDIIRTGILKYVEYIKYNNIDKKYVKQGSTWFNGECWNDEYDILEKGVNNDTEYTRI